MDQSQNAELVSQRAWRWLGGGDEPEPPLHLDELSPTETIATAIVFAHASALLGPNWRDHEPLLRDLGEVLANRSVSNTSFFAFLHRNYGEPAFARFVQSALRTEIGAAATLAFGRTYATLRLEWQTRLRAPKPGERATHEVLRQSARLLRPYVKSEVELLLLMTFDACLGLAVPLSTKYLFDEVITPHDLSRLGPWLVVICLVFLAGLLATYRRMLVSGRIGESVLRDLRRNAFSHLQRLSVRFYLRSSTGDLLSRLTNDMYAVEQSMAHVLPGLAFQILSLALGCAALLLLNFWMGLLVLCIGVPLFAVIYTRTSQRVREASRALQEQYSVELSFLNEQLTSQSVVKPFGLEGRAVRSFEIILRELFGRSLRLVRLGAGLSLGSQMVVLAIQLTVFGLGAWLIATGHMTVGELVAFSGLIGPVLSPIAGIAEQYRALQASVGALDRIDELLSEVPDVVEDPLATALPRLSREVRFDHVTFGYTPDEPVLHDISLTIPAGARVAVVGPSGSGKSTLVGLLLRHFDPDAGRVLFDGRDIREVSLASLRDQQAIVPQDALLFNATVAENILLGQPNATPAEVKAAADAAVLHDFVSQSPKGYAAPVGERGQWLSGGQRQRLAIARALVRNPQVLLLDEATSALDAATEANILETLDRVAQGRTVLMITHRLSAAMHCDQIFVLSEGRLCERGTHHELLEQRGVYWRLFTEQLAYGAERSPALDPARLARIPLFAQLSREELKALATQLSTEDYAAGQVIVTQGDPADRLYVIGRGRVEIIHDQMESQPVNVLGEGSFFGEMALLDTEGGVRTATVRALEPTQAFALHQQDFLNLLESRPRLAEAVTQLARRRRIQLDELVKNSALSL